MTAAAHELAKGSMRQAPETLADVIGHIPYRLALAGGWIDQPFVSRLNPKPPGAMVVVAIEPTFRAMDRSGLATGTREIASRRWNGRLPARPPADLVRELYAAENAGKSEPSGSQDMIGLIYPGISRLEYDAAVEGGVFPAQIESMQDNATARWLEKVLHVLPVAPRPDGYNPLGEKHLDPSCVGQLGQTGKNCFAAIAQRDMRGLGKSMNDCMHCWATLLPHTVRHPSLNLDLLALLRVYQARYFGAMYSGCGGGYLLVIADELVPGAFQVQVRTSPA
jgi:hypothetical protein